VSVHRQTGEVPFYTIMKPQEAREVQTEGTRLLKEIPGVDVHSTVVISDVFLSASESRSSLMSRVQEGRSGTGGALASEVVARLHAVLAEDPALGTSDESRLNVEFLCALISTVGQLASPPEDILGLLRGCCAMLIPDSITDVCTACINLQRSLSIALR